MEYFGKGYFLSTIIFYAGFYVIKKYFWYPKPLTEGDNNKKEDTVQECCWGQFIDIEIY